MLLERGAHSYVTTFDGHPYVAPFSGNIVELCPVGALTSAPRFRAGRGTSRAPARSAHCARRSARALTVRDERVLRVLAREHDEVDDGWLCDKGRFACQAFTCDERVTEPLLRDGGELRPVSWERALEEAASGLRARAPSRGRSSVLDADGGLFACASDARGARLSGPGLASRRHAGA